MATSKFLSVILIFSPLHYLHLSSSFICSPFPLQSKHLAWVWVYIPGPNWANLVTTPVPLHLVHFVTFLPPFPSQPSQVRALTINLTTLWSSPFSWLRCRPLPKLQQARSVWACLCEDRWAFFPCRPRINRRVLRSLNHQEALHFLHPIHHTHHRAASFQGLRALHRRLIAIWIFMGLLLCRDVPWGPFFWKPFWFIR